MRLVIFCPVCQKHDLVRVPVILEKQRNEIDRGLVPILIKQVICPHNFIAYVDRNWKVRRFMPVTFDDEFPHMFQLEEQQFQKYHLTFERKGLVYAKS